jgi:hypothetical protein
MSDDQLIADEIARRKKFANKKKKKKKKKAKKVIQGGVAGTSRYIRDSGNH